MRIICSVINKGSMPHGWSTIIFIQWISTYSLHWELQHTSCGTQQKNKSWKRESGIQLISNFYFYHSIVKQHQLGNYVPYDNILQKFANKPLKDQPFIEYWSLCSFIDPVIYLTLYIIHSHRFHLFTQYSVLTLFTQLFTLFTLYQHNFL